MLSNKNKFLLYSIFILLICLLNGLSAQQLDFKTLGPFPVFEYDEMFVAPSGELYITASERKEVYHSLDGVQWSLVFESEEIQFDHLYFMNDDQVLLESRNSLHILDNLGGLDTIFSSSNQNRSLNDIEVFNDIIYVAYEGVVYSSTDRGQSFEAKYGTQEDEVQSSFLAISPQYIYIGQDTCVSLLSHDFNLVRTIEIVLRDYTSLIGIETNINDDLLVFTGFSHVGTDGGAFFYADYSLDQGESWEQIDHTCMSDMNVILTNDYIIARRALNSLILVNIDSGEKEHLLAFEIGRVVANGEVVYLYDDEKLMFIDPANIGSSQRINFERKFSRSTISHHKIASNGVIYVTLGPGYGFSKSGSYALFVSDDAGESWVQISTNQEKILSIDVDVNDHLHLFTEHSYLYSTDNGASFTQRRHEQYIDTPSSIPTTISRPQEPFGANPPFNYLIALDQDNMFLRSFRYSCGGLGGVPWPKLTTVNGNMETPAGPFAVQGDSGLGLYHLYNYNGVIYGANNTSENYGFSQFDNESLAFQKLLDDYPSNVLIVDDNQIHFNEPLIRSASNLLTGPSYVSTDFGQTFIPLGSGPRGTIHKGPGPEGTYVFNGRLYYRKSYTDNYKQIDISGIPTRIDYVDSDYKGNLFLFDYNGHMYSISESILHPQIISGNLYLDRSTDCTLQDTVLNKNNWIVKVEGENYSVQQFVNNGKFDFHAPTGEYSVEIVPPSSRWQLCDAVQNISLSSNENADVDFFFYAEEDCDDMTVSISRSALRRCRERPFVVSVLNNNPDKVVNSRVRITHDPFLSFSEFEYPHESVNDTIIDLYIDEISGFESLDIDMHLGVSCEADLGQVHCVNVEVLSPNKCTANTESTFTTYDLNIGPYDPNDIRVFNDEGHQALTFDKNEWHTYYVRFQNTGTDTAFDVRVNTILDDSLDVSSLRFLDASHNYTSSFNDLNHLVVRFDNIMLPDSNVNVDGSQGYFTFKIKPISDIEYGTHLSSYANIYFDFNAPITTNQGESVIDVPCGVAYELREESICSNEREYMDSLQIYRSGQYDLLLRGDCDTRTILDATIIRGYDYQDNIYVCEGEEVEGFIDTTIVESHVIMNGCDSIINHNYISVPWVANTSTDIVSCGNLAYRGYTEDGIYMDTMRYRSGCFVNTLNLSFDRRDSIQKTICEGESYRGFDATGVYGLRVDAPGFCDSLYVIDLQVNEAEISFIDTTICQGEEFMGYSTSGFHVVSIKEDSLCKQVFLDLLVLHESEEECLPTSTKEISEDHVSISPNPSNGVFYMHWQDDVPYRTEIIVYNADGVQILTLQDVSSRFEIDLAKHPAGIYFIHIHSDLLSTVKKLIRE